MQIPFHSRSSYSPLVVHGSMHEATGRIITQLSRMVKQRHASINLEEPELVVRTIHHAIEEVRAPSCGSRIAIGMVTSSTVELTPNDRITGLS
jgi:hypothetical protein